MNTDNLTVKALDWNRNDQVKNASFLKKDDCALKGRC